MASASPRSAALRNQYDAFIASVEPGNDASDCSASLNTLLTAASATRSFGSSRWAKITHAMAPSILVGCKARRTSNSALVASSSLTSFARFALESSSSASLFASAARASRSSRYICANSTATRSEVCGVVIVARGGHAAAGRAGK
eukprot:31363-Pelagococcus_subviridis.AAC.10